MSGEGILPAAHRCFVSKPDADLHLTNAERSVLEWLQIGPASSAELAARLRTTPETIKVHVCRLRKKGFAIYSPRKASMAGTRKGVDQSYRLGDGA
ncbi:MULTISPECIES: LuxR C-terminal-related transcriptional regulator [unclassified Novosphingobium]|uniref:LuxR C-terminal-related transcriptional regulator n=1 Tax=unclassified Novosphingobium TaxID=2644732 RepID=UPI000D326812|nr:MULTISPECIES: LuxR C-terminal-related transcriptional regulator [unclassified Novosphingobium]PTR05386.1 regulatory LuxR family protein [Novosphingobium sp. GV055]PUA93950.1 regulatory LuxR family protein [Novosphingobium sp. GV061]PUB11367.1 regulatory LuxR family protein [Novosphingobium sp. GV079]PUB37057.1 regulatory LuxR family protein [Novosphingobium sp. GV027]